MTRIERLLIICFLVSRSMDVEKTVEFVNVIESGCLAHEQDSIDYKNDLVATARQAPLDERYGPILMLLMEAHKVETSVELLRKHEHHLDQILAKLNVPTQNRIAEKILVSKLEEMIKNHPSAAQNLN